MNAPSISVVIPAYNAESTIERAIDSVLAQTMPAAEIIVVDDGSSDQLAAVVSRYVSPVRLIQQTNSQAAAARNRGIEAASGEFVGFLDADDYWEPQKLQRQLAVIERHPEVNIVGGRYYSMQPGGNRSLRSLRNLRWYDRPMHRSGSQAFMLGTMLWTGTVLVRRSALQNEKFVPGLEPAEDRDLWIRLASKHVIYLLSEPLATAVLEPGGIRVNIAKDCTKMLEVIQRHQRMLGMPSRLIWKSYIRYRWAAIDPSPSTSLPLLLKSIVSWPIPLTGMPAMKRLGRLKRLAYLLKQLIRRSDRAQGATS